MEGKKVLAFALICFSILNLNAQQIPEWAYNYLHKNLISYEIITAANKNSLTIDKPYFPTLFFNEVIPDINCSFDYTSKKLDTTYPKANYIIYDCTINLYNNKCKEYVKERKIVDAIPDKEYTERKIIIAIDTLKKDVLFVSGRAFLSDLSADFNFLKTDKDIMNYLNFRLKALQTENLKIKKSTNENISFDAFSKFYNNNVEIIFDKKKLNYVIKIK